MFHRHGLFIIISLSQLWTETTANNTITINVTSPSITIETGSIGISPYWYQAKKCIYFVDSDAKTINRYDPDSDAYFRVRIVANLSNTRATYQHISFVIPVEGQSDWFAVGLGETVGVVFWDGESTDAIKPKFEIPVITTPDLLIMAGKTDFYGQLWLAIAGNKTGSVYVIDSSDGAVTTSISDIARTRAIAWGFDYKRLFYIDGNKIMALEANMHEKSLTNKWEVFDSVKSNASCTPYDLIVDMGGYLCVTCNFIYEYILQVNPQDSTFVQIQLPPSITDAQPFLVAIVYAGLGRRELFATTADYNPRLRYLNVSTKGLSGPESKAVVLPSNWPGRSSTEV